MKRVDKATREDRGRSPRAKPYAVNVFVGEPTDKPWLSHGRSEGRYCEVTRTLAVPYSGFGVRRHLTDVLGHDEVSARLADQFRLHYSPALKGKRAKREQAHAADDEAAYPRDKKRELRESLLLGPSRRQHLMSACKVVEQLFFEEVKPRRGKPFLRVRNGVGDLAFLEPADLHRLQRVFSRLQLNIDFAIYRRKQERERLRRRRRPKKD